VIAALFRDSNVVALAVVVMLLLGLVRSGRRRQR
jgi:hypothetical protein